MTTQEIVNRARRLWGVSSWQYSDANAIEDLNVIYHDLENDIVTKIREDYFWDFFITDTVVWQSEYTLPQWIWEWWTELEKWDWVFVDYWDWFVKARRLSQNWLEKDDSYYKDYQSTTDPFYYIKDESLFVFPSPKEAVTWWLKMEWIKWLSDLTISSTEADVFNWKIPVKFHPVIALWMLEYIYQSRWMINEASNSMNIYALKKSEIIRQLQDRDYMPVEVQDINLSNFS